MIDDGDIVWSSMSADADTGGDDRDLNAEVNDDDLAFPYQDLWYIKLIPNEKNPIESWGGYDQDFTEALNVYTHDQVVDSTHDHWGIVGIRTDAGDRVKLLIFDIDIHKAPDDFDPDHVRISDDKVPLVKSQSGGFHVYTAVRSGGEHGSESDFSTTTYLPFHIDIRGNYVKHHVVAPTEIPGVDTDYSLVNDTVIRTVEPSDACEYVWYAADVDADPEDTQALIDHDPETGIGAGGFRFDPDTEPPEDLPTCYARGLQLRAENPDDHPNTHKVNTLTALCGLWLRYDTDEIIEHFVEEYPPGDDLDREETEYQLGKLGEKVAADRLAPPACATLRDYGILDDGKTCDCEIHAGADGATRWSTATTNDESEQGDGAEDGDLILTYEILPEDEGDVELQLVPIDGTSVAVELRQNGHVEYSEVRDRGFWHSSTVRDRIASEAAKSLTGVEQDAVKRGVKDAITKVGIDEREEPEAFEDAMRSDREQALRDRTERVVCHPAADSAEWVVLMAPPEESEVDEPRELSFSEGDFNDANAGALRNFHLATFYEKVDLDHEEWSNLTDYWLSIQKTTEYEPDLQLDAAVEKFLDWVENLRVWADEDGFSWSNLHGYYAEDYHNGADAVLVSGQKVADWRNHERVDPQLDLSKELRERDIMLRSTTRERINGKRRRVWPIAADATDHSPETARQVDDGEGGDNESESSGDRPEGLR